MSPGQSSPTPFYRVIFGKMKSREAQDDARMSKMYLEKVWKFFENFPKKYIYLGTSGVPLGTIFSREGPKQAKIRLKIT